MVTSIRTFPMTSSLLLPKCLDYRHSILVVTPHLPFRDPHTILYQQSPMEFLDSILSRYTTPPPSRPFLTLSFAQSLDAKIAGQNGKQLIISGEETMIMTHW